MRLDAPPVKRPTIRMPKLSPFLLVGIAAASFWFFKRKH
jgi:hypothetical protein